MPLGILGIAADYIGTMQVTTKNSGGSVEKLPSGNSEG